MWNDAKHHGNMLMSMLIWRNNLFCLPGNTKRNYPHHEWRWKNTKSRVGAYLSTNCSKLWWHGFAATGMLKCFFTDEFAVELITESQNTWCLSQTNPRFSQEGWGTSNFNHSYRLFVDFPVGRRNDSSKEGLIFAYLVSAVFHIASHLTQSTNTEHCFQLNEIFHIKRDLNLLFSGLLRN
jgi:hypothetical protein